MSRYFALLLVGIIFGMFGVMIHWNSLMFGDLFQVVLRNALALVLLLPILFYKQISLTFTKTEWKWLLLYGGVSVFGFVLVTLAYLSTDIKTVLAVRYFTSVVASFLISILIFKEAITRVNLLAMFIVLFGITIFAYPFQGFFQSGVLYSILTALAFLILGMIIKKVTLKPEVLMMSEYLVVVTVVFGLVLLLDAPMIIGSSMLALVSILIFGVLLIIVTYLIIYGYRKTNFNLANIILTSEIFFGIFFGYMFLNQTITTVEAVGISLIFLSAILPNLVGLMRKNKTRVFVKA